MQELCKLCDPISSKTISLICAIDLEIFCEDCIEKHLATESEGHKVRPIGLFEEEKAQAELLRVENTFLISEALKQKLMQEKGQLDYFIDKIKEILFQKRNDLISQIDDLIEIELDQAIHSKDVTNFQLASMIEDIESNFENNSLVEAMTQRFNTEEEIDILTFVDVRNSVISNSFEIALKQELNYTIKSYKTAKPISLYFFKSMTNKCLAYNSLNNKIDTREIDNQL